MDNVLSAEKTVWTASEAQELSREYFGDDLAAQVYLGKYALRNEKGEILEPTPDYMHRRLAREFARIEAKYPNPMSESEIYGFLCKRPGHLGMGPIIPQGSPMSAIGNPYKIQSLSNCFVIAPPEDSYGGILYTDQEEAQIMKRRGGVGFDISTIRPKGMHTANAAGTTDGIGVFMERFSNTCREVGQGGRRGALMLSISVKHPQIETFINLKRDRKKVTGANVSIRITNEFMRAVETDSEFTLQWPVDVPLAEAKVTRKVRALDIWDQIIDAAWDSAEPGVLFWNTIVQKTPTDAYASKGYATSSTNPCSEITLSCYDACRLLVIDLTHFVNNEFTFNADFDFEKFDLISQKAQRLMDDIVDLELEAIDRIIDKVNSDPESVRTKQLELDMWKRIRKVNADGRRTGLGVTGLGDALAMLGVKYGSRDSVRWTEKIYKSLTLSAYKSSVTLAEERGPFTAYEYELEKEQPFITQIVSENADLRERWKKFGRRNIALTTTAPVGSVSTMTQTTSGIEPAFMLSYTRRKKINPNDVSARVDFVDALGDKWTNYPVYHHYFKRWMDVTGKSDVSDSPYATATSNEIDPLTSVKIQAAAQKWICHSISKTCNLPQDVSHQTVSDLYLAAWKQGCKGFTVYRDKSRDGVLVTDTKVSVDLATRYDGVPVEEVQHLIRVGRKYSEHMPQAYLDNLVQLEEYVRRRAGGNTDDAQVFDRSPQITENHAPKRPKELPCEIHQVKINGEFWTILVGLLDNTPYEIFGGLSQYIEIPKKWKAGTLLKNGKKDGVATYNLQFGPPDEETKVKDVVSVFENKTYGAFTRTISLALRHGIPIQYVVEQLMKDKHSDMQSFSRVIARVLKTYIKDGTKSGSSVCPECGAKDSLVYQEKCVICVQCSSSKCG